MVRQTKALVLVVPDSAFVCWLRSNTALLTDAYHSALRTSCGAAKRER
jgi:hypothetical protein